MKGNKMSFQEQASRAISLLTLIEVEGNSIERIISVVQENNKYFGARLGESCLEKAADKLEQLVSEAAQQSVQRTAICCVCEQEINTEIHDRCAASL